MDFDLITYRYHFSFRNTNEKSMKVVRMFSEEPTDKREIINKWYPRHNETYILMKKLREYGLFRDEHEDFKEEMKRLRRLRGKGPPERKAKAN